MPISMDELAAEYGYARAFLNSNDELRSVFRRAVRETWTGPKIVAEIRSTRWFRRTSESKRKAQMLRTSDPAEYNSRVQAMYRNVRNMMAGAAGTTSAKRQRQIARQAVENGWTEEQIKFVIGNATNYTKLVRSGNLGGEAGQVEDQIRAWARQYGVKVSDGFIGGRVNNIMKGLDDPTRILSRIQEMAKERYPGYGNAIDSGKSMEDIAQSYIQTLAETLEVADSRVGIFNNHVQRALTWTNDQGNPSAIPLWKFEQQLRKTPRWKKTQNAQDKLLGVGHKVLQDLGFSV